MAMSSLLGVTDVYLTVTNANLKYLVLSYESNK